MVYHSNSTIDGLDITNYWQYFNLDCDPFAMNSEESLIYIPAYWEEMLDLMQYIVHYKNQLAVVTGSNGTGKTVIADLLETQLGESVHCVKIFAEQNMSVMNLLEFLSDAFLVPWQPEGDIEQLLDDQLEAFQHKEKNCLLLIDSAQLLPTDTLEALLYFVAQQSETQMRFHIVLFGEHVLHQTLQRMLEPTEESLVHFLTLEPLSLEETQSYLNYRLSAAGWKGANPMNEEVIARIFRLSEGNPARINRIARRFLLDLLTEQAEDGKTSWFGKHMAQFVGGGLILIILLILAVWIWRSNMLQHVVAVKSDVIKPTVTMNGATVPAAQIKYVDPTALNAPQKSEDKPVTQDTVKPTIDANNKVEPIVISSVPAPVSVQAAPVIDKVQQKVTQQTPSDTAEASLPQVVAAVPAIPSSVQNSAAASPVAETVDSAVISNNAAVAPAVSPAKSKQPIVAHKKVTEVAAPSEKGDYTIQLLSVQHNGSLAQFIKENHLENKVQVVTHRVNGKKMTQIFYGSYKTMYDAEQAITTLPPNLLSAAPWPRKK